MTLTIVAIVLVVLGIIALVMSQAVLGWILVAVGVIVFIVKLVKGKKTDTTVPPQTPPVTPAQ